MKSYLCKIPKCNRPAFKNGFCWLHNLIKLKEIRELKQSQTQLNMGGKIK